MFKMVAGNNGRSVYAGYVENIQGETFELTGTEWDPKNKVEFQRRLALKFDIDLPETHLSNGEFIIVSVLPSRKDPDRGVAEEIAKLGQAIEITNEKGNEKIIFLGKVHTKKWNKNHTILSVSFRGIQDVEGAHIGSPSTYRNLYGEEVTSYWINISLFPPGGQFKTSYTADKGDRDFEKGSIAAMVIGQRERVYNGKTYQQFRMTKYMLPRNHPAQQKTNGAF